MKDKHGIPLHSGTGKYLSVYDELQAAELEIIEKEKRIEVLKSIYKKMFRALVFDELVCRKYCPSRVGLKNFYDIQCKKIGSSQLCEMCWKKALDCLDFQLEQESEQ